MKKEKIIAISYQIYLIFLSKPYFLDNDISFRYIKPVISNYLSNNDNKKIRAVFNTMLRNNLFKTTCYCGEKRRASRYRLVHNKQNNYEKEIRIVFD